MAHLTIELPPDLEKSLQVRTVEAGFGSPQEYVRALIEADSGPLPEDAGPPHLYYSNDTELEAMLLEAINSVPGREISPEEWEQKREDLRIKFARPAANVQGVLP